MIILPKGRDKFEDKEKKNHLFKQAIYRRSLYICCLCTADRDTLDAQMEYVCYGIRCCAGHNRYYSIVKYF